MKITAIVCFVLSAISGLRSVLAIAVGVNLMLKPGSDIRLEVFFPEAVGMMLVPLVLLIIGLLCWKKWKRPGPPPLPLIR